MHIFIGKMSMYLLILFSLALKLLLRHTERTAVTVMMLVPVVALLVSSNMVVGGYLQQASASVGLVKPSDAYVAYQAGSSSPYSSSIGYDSYLSIAQSNVSSALPLLTFPATITDGGRTVESSVLATNTTAFASLRQSFVYGKVAVNGATADVGGVLAQILSLKAGDVVTVDAFSQSQTLRVVGVLNSTDQSDTSLILPISSAWSLWPQTADKASYVEFSSADNATLSRISAGMTVAREEGIYQIAKSFDAQTSNLLANWTYVILVLSATAAVAAASRVVTEVSKEYRTVRAIGANLSAARALVFYELFIISGVAVVMGAALGVVSTSVLGTLFKAMDGLPLFPNLQPIELVKFGAASFLLVLGAGSVSLAWLPRKISEAGEAP